MVPRQGSHQGDHQLVQAREEQRDLLIGLMVHPRDLSQALLHGQVLGLKHHWDLPPCLGNAPAHREHLNVLDLEVLSLRQNHTLLNIDTSPDLCWDPRVHLKLWMKIPVIRLAC